MPPRQRRIPALWPMRANGVQRDVTFHGLEPYFPFHGALYGEALLSVLKSIDIGVSPDPKNPMNDISTMNKVMEHMTLEKPLVQFDLTEGRASAAEASLCAHGNDPVDFATRIAVLIADPALRARLGKLGRARVMDQLLWAHSAPKLLATYDRVFAKRSS